MASNTSTNGSHNTKGTILLTGANGSLGFWIAYNLLRNYPSHHAILAVRDDSAQDKNTTKLREMASAVRDAHFSIEILDLASLQNVRSFADSVTERISSRKLAPISAIICNAFTWSLSEQKKSADGFDLTFQVSHLSHFVLVLKLLDSMDKNSGRIVLLGSDQHDFKNRNSMNPLGTVFPEDLYELVNPTADKPGEEMARGFQRYGNAKLANIMFMHQLNRKLLQDPAFEHITAVAIDPGNMADSRCFNHTPLKMRIMIVVIRWMYPILRYIAKNFSTLEAAGDTVAWISMDAENAGAKGYFVKREQSISSNESQDETKQEDLWTCCKKWAKLDGSETCLK